MKHIDELEQLETELEIWLLRKYQGRIRFVPAESEETVRHRLTIVRGYLNLAREGMELQIDAIQHHLRASLESISLKDKEEMRIRLQRIVDQYRMQQTGILEHAEGSQLH